MLKFTIFKKWAYFWKEVSDIDQEDIDNDFENVNNDQEDYENDQEDIDIDQKDDGQNQDNGASGIWIPDTETLQLLNDLMRSLIQNTEIKFTSKLNPGQLDDNTEERLVCGRPFVRKKAKRNGDECSTSRQFSLKISFLDHKFRIF